MISEKYDLGALIERVGILRREYQELLLAREKVAVASTKFRATLMADLASYVSNLRMKPNPTPINCNRQISNTLARAAKRISAIH